MKPIYDCVEIANNESLGIDLTNSKIPNIKLNNKRSITIDGTPLKGVKSYKITSSETGFAELVIRLDVMAGV